ncbi:MAG: glycosyltransferase family 4 protein [Chloroflexota bacterium]|nr:glycosyltransferase family 4 protein [Chloroflexota bacterium]
MNHVAILLLAPFVSGAEHQTLALCRYLRRRCRVTLFANDELVHLLATDPFLCQYTAGLDVQPLGSAFPAAAAATPRGLLARGLLYPRLQRAAWDRLRRLRPDVVHLLLAPSFFAYAPLFHLLPYPTVLTLSGEMRYARHFYGPTKRAAVRYAVARADALVVCSADELINLTAVSPQAVERAALLDNFTDVARFAPAAPLPEAGASEGNPTPAKEPLVTFAARLHPEKGALLFLDAVARVHAIRPEARFALMGKGEMEPQVSRQLVALGLTGAVTRGFTTDLAPLLARSAVFVSCQRYENLGSSSLLEAMASANAVVATDVGQTWRIVDDTVGCRVAADAPAIAGAISALIAEPDRAARLGRAARERVLERYGPEPYVERILEVYARAQRRRAR